MGIGAHLFKKCGNNWMPGITTKAGKVMRLKDPKTRRKPRTTLAAMADRFCPSLIFMVETRLWETYIFTHNALDNNKTP
jgi:hypothetical protein